MPIASGLDNFRNSAMTDNGVSRPVRGFSALSFPQPEGGIVTVVYPLVLSRGPQRRVRAGSFGLGFADIQRFADPRVTTISANYSINVFQRGSLNIAAFGDVADFKAAKIISSGSLAPDENGTPRHVADASDPCPNCGAN